MPHAVRLMSAPAVGAGFALAGFAPLEVDDPAQGAARLRELLADPSAGVVLLEDRLYEALPDELRRTLGRYPLPLVVPYPGPTWLAREEAAEAYIVELLRQVIGYRVRLR